MDINLPVKQKPLETGFNPLQQHGEELSLAEIKRVFFKRRVQILLVAAAVFCVAVIYAFSATPIYESAAKLQIDPSRSGSSGLDDLLKEKLSSDNPSSQIATQVNILESDTIASQVIKKLALAQNPDFAGVAASPKAPVSTSDMTPAARRQFLGEFHRALSIQAIPNTQIVEVRFQNRNPKLATDVVNAVIKAYIERNFQTRFDGTAQVASWLSSQMEELKTQAVQAQQKLAEFQRQNGVLGADENDNIVLDRLKHLNLQLAEAESDRIVKEARYRMASSGDPELITAASPSTTLQFLRNQQADLRAQLAQLNSRYGSGYPRVRELQEQLEKLDASIAAEVNKVGKHLEEEYRTAAKTESMIRAQFEEQKNEAYKLNEHIAQYAILRHEVESSSGLYDNLQLKLKEAGVTAGLSSSYISVVDQGEVPAAPVKPNKKYNLFIGLLSGFFIGVVSAFVLESLDDNLWSSEELEQSSGLPVLSAIPAANSDETAHKRSKTIGQAQQEISAPVVFANSKSQVAEAYRTLRASVLLCCTDGNSKVLLVTSSLPSEGKTTTATNLAVALAQRGESVLLVDADLRRSSVHRHFGMGRSSTGLSTILAQGHDDRAIHSPIEELPNLRVIYAGPHPPNPAEAMASKRMAQLVAQWCTEYDHVVIDSAPVLAVSDALSVSALADGVIVVVRSGVARKRAVLRVRDLLRRSNARIIGTVLNDVNMKLEHHYYYSYGSRYGYRGEICYYESKED